MTGVQTCALPIFQVPRVQNAHSGEADEKLKWATLFTRQGLGAFAQLAQSCAGDYCVGDSVSAADLFVVPQIYNARRFQLDVAAEFPLLEQIYQKCFSTPECVASSPEKQIDAVTT